MNENSNLCLLKLRIKCRSLLSIIKVEKKVKKSL